MANVQMTRAIGSSEQDFSRTFLHEKKENALPHQKETTSLATASRESRDQMQKPTLFKPSSSSPQTGVIWARIIDELYEGRVVMQHRANDLLHTEIKKRNHLDDTAREVVKKQAAKHKEQDWWNYLGNSVETLTQAATLIGGAALIGVGATTVNPSITWAGQQMTAGSALSLLSRFMEQMGIGQGSTTSRLLNWAGIAISARGAAAGAPIILNQIGNIATGVAKTVVNEFRHASFSRREKLRGEFEVLNSHFSNVQRDRTKSDDDLSNIGNSHKKSDLVHLAKSVASQEDEKNRVLSRILHGSKA